MKFCTKCGNQMADTAKFCTKCGATTGKPQESAAIPHQELLLSPAKKKKKWPYFIALIVIVPFMLAALASLGNLFISTPEAPSTSLSGNSHTATTTSASLPPETTQAPMLKGIDDEELYANIKEACASIGLDLSEVKQVVKTGSWAAGDRLSLTYRSHNIEIFLNGDNTVNSIDIGEVQVYKQGLSPLSIDDYLLPPDRKDALQTLAEATVRSALNFPSTANFKLFEWGYGRAGDIYLISGTVSAKNAFNVKSDMKFYLEFRATDKSLKAEYFVLEGAAVLGKKSVVKIPNRKEVPIETKKASNGSFELIEGTLGKYGKKVTIDGDEYIVYNVPKGSYTVKSNVNFCTVFVEKKAPKKTAEGYTEHEIVATHRFENGANNLKISVGADEWVNLTLHAKVEFTPIPTD